MQIGPYQLKSNTVLAPMAGVTDLPFRKLCQSYGAGLLVSEMLTADISLWNSRKSQQRFCHQDEVEPRTVQIAGGDPEMLAIAAAANVKLGAQIIDINMGCPAKKVCKKAAGSALLKDEKLVAEILAAVVKAVDVPVTLKTRLGWDQQQKNIVSIARIAEDAGVAAISIHGRTRACKFEGEVDYHSISLAKRSIDIPVIANGDINNPLQAKIVLAETGADGIMIGRAAQGKPWIFQQINHYLKHGEICAEPDIHEQAHILQNHIAALHEFYGEFLGLRIARKHVAWYIEKYEDSQSFKSRFNKIDIASSQINELERYFEALQKLEGKVA